MLLANLLLSSFQKRLGLDTASKPGEEMLQAINLCQAKNIPFSLIDRDIQQTFQRAWGQSNLWNKLKLVSLLVSLVFTREEMDTVQVEDLKKKSALHGMLEELAGYLPLLKRS